MARPMQQSITCPQCGQPFSAILEQILDVGVDPSVKERLLSGRVNLISCPHCGYQGMIGTPLMYHDPSKPLAIIYVPMELNLDVPQREKMIGEMTSAAMRTLPEDAPKGYLLQPDTALTLQGLVDQVLEADGITREMIDAERRKVELLEELAQASKEEADQILAENEALIDRGFLELLAAGGEALSQQGRSRESLRLFNIRKRLLETTEAGQEIMAQEAALAEASEELKALGEDLDREQFVDLLVNAADNPLKVQALAALGRILLDYSTFQIITERIDSAESDETREKLTEMREMLLEIAAAYEKQSQAIIEEAINTLRTILQSPDIRAAVAANVQRIDQTFLTVLQANLDEARKAGNVEASSRLNQIREEVMRLVEAAAPPEIQLINHLLSVETEEESLALVNEHSEEITSELVEMMEELVPQLRNAGNDMVADRLEVILEEAQKLV